MVSPTVLRRAQAGLDGQHATGVNVAASGMAHPLPYQGHPDRRLVTADHFHEGIGVSAQRPADQFRV